MEGKKVLFLSAAFLLPVLFLAGCIGGGNTFNANINQSYNEATPAPASVSVNVDDAQSSPAVVNVVTNQYITMSFKNIGKSVHSYSITNLNVNTGPVAPGEVKQVTFTAPSSPGTYTITSESSAVATLVVKSGSGSVSGGASANASANVTGSG